MTLQEAISILKIHQQWRLGADIVMIEPKELTEGINIILAQLPQQEISDEEIEKVSNTLGDDYYASELIMWEKGAKWYREQLKQNL